MGDPKRDAEKYKHRAEEYRAVAEVARNSISRGTYLHLAKTCDALAERAARRAKAMRLGKDPRLS